MIQFSGQFANGKPYLRKVLTRYDAQVEIDTLWVCDLVTREEWSRITDWLAAPDEPLPNPTAKHDQFPPPRNPTIRIPDAEWGDS